MFPVFVAQAEKETVEKNAKRDYIKNCLKYKNPRIIREGSKTAWVKRICLPSLVHKNRVRLSL
jgi:hypothetical protein